MSRLIAKILLTVFMIPFAAMVYTITFIVQDRVFRYSYTYSSYNYSRILTFVYSGLVAWAVIAAYWLLLWRGQIRWTSSRISLTFLSALVCTAACTVFGKLLNMLISLDTFSAFAASALCPIFWLISTVLIWRENAEERASRVAGGDENAVTCPICGYNLTGLSEPRCPECGTKFTLNDLFSQQPGRTTINQDREIAG